MDEIRQKIEQFLHEKGIEASFDVTIPEDIKNGDFTSNAALTLFANPIFRDKNAQIGSPRDIAGEIAHIFHDSSTFEKVEVAGPGFVNFYLSKNVLSEVLGDPVPRGVDSHFKDKRIAVEFGDPNPFKQIHIGHLRNFAIGESFARILEQLGASVTRLNYQGDVGLHVAKALYGLMKNPDCDISNNDLPFEEKIKRLASAYAYGATEFEENETAKQEIIELNKKVYSGDQEIEALWEEGRRISLEDFDRFYELIGVSYSKKYFESETSVRGREIVLSHIDDGVFERDQGALIYRGEKDGLHTRVFLTSQDYATYEGKDLGLAVIKEEDLHPDLSYILTGNEQAEYFQVMLAALSKIDKNIRDKTKHFTFGHVRLKDGKMSSRTGDVITAQWLLEEATDRVLKAFDKTDRDIAQKIGIGAVKYSMLKFGITSDIHFDFDDSISLEGNSGPYLQYTYVRTQSVCARVGHREIHLPHLAEHSLNEEEDEVIRYLARFPRVVEEAAEKFAPNLICNYLFELSQKYNLFYQKHKIIDSDQENVRLQITRAVGEVLQKGLSLLGIETVERM